MATIRKLPSGNHRIEKMINGKRLSMVLEYRPRQREADLLLYELYKNQGNILGPDSFSAAAEKYIRSKDNVLSPSTIVGYRIVLKRLPKEFQEKLIKSITREDVQLCINALSGKYSPKSVRNASGFISAVMRSRDSSWMNLVSLPQKRPAEFYVPEKEDVKKLLDYAKGSKYEIPLWLACFGLRRSEIAALNTSDLSGHVLRINKALVKNERREWVEKSTKNLTSTREIVVSDYVARLIQELPAGKLFTGSLNALYSYLMKAEDELGIPRFSIHKLRHFFASTARETMGDTYVEDMGGWKHGSQIMRKVYDYSQKKEAAKAKKDFAERLSALF